MKREAQSHVRGALRAAFLIYHRRKEGAAHKGTPMSGKIKSYEKKGLLLNYLPLDQNDT